MNKREGVSAPDKRLAAVCGLFCPACTMYIATKEDPERLQTLAGRQRRPVGELECHGCRSEKRCFYCQENCKMAKCAAEKGLEFCGECTEYPCAELVEFQAQKPHRIELWRSHELIAQIGYEKWYEQMIEHFSCPECGTLNSAYDISCRKCGASPSCRYVSLHKEEIVRYIDSIMASS
ncbi:MAG: DUF3795 domain-containing protein [Syntrophobacter sp.]